MPDVPAETVTVDGETDSEKLLAEDEEVDPEPPQPASPKPSAVRTRRQQRLRNW
jgi:hypothetical protein